MQIQNKMPIWDNRGWKFAVIRDLFHEKKDTDNVYFLPIVLLFLEYNF